MASQLRLLENLGKDPVAAIRSGSRTAPLELFDLREDVAETNNLAASHPEVLAKLEAYLKTAREDSPDWPLFK